jgi:hypothetical protein
VLASAGDGDRRPKAPHFVSVFFAEKAQNAVPGGLSRALAKARLNVRQERRESAPVVLIALDEVRLEAFQRTAMAHLTSVPIAISFLNCRNVHLVAGEAAPKPLAKAHHRKTGQWLSRHQVIDITPMSRFIVDREQGEGGPGRNRAPRILCAGTSSANEARSHRVVNSVTAHDTRLLSRRAAVRSCTRWQWPAPA